MARSDWTLLAISFAKDRGLSPVQLQKSLFLLGQQMADEVGPAFYSFIAYSYGPFDRLIYSDASGLALQGKVSVTQSGSGYNTYSITPWGMAEVGLLKQGLPQRAVSHLEKIVEWTQSLSFADLVRAIYAKYPEYRENSVFQG